jgi:hypothetical protein
MSIILRRFKLTHLYQLDAKYYLVNIDCLLRFSDLSNRKHEVQDCDDCHDEDKPVAEAVDPV